jgi:carbon monoxide dehydrogenase subunit G
MIIEGRQTYPADAEVLLSLLNEPAALQKILPGCEVLESIAPNQFRIEIKLRVGKAIEQFSGNLALDQVASFNGFIFRADGASGSGTVNVQGHVSLEAKGDGRTILSYTAEIVGDGQSKGISSRMLETTARAYARRCLESLERQVATQTRVYTTSTLRPEPVPPQPPVYRIEVIRRLIALASLLMVIFILWRSLNRRRSSDIFRQIVRASKDLGAKQLANTTLTVDTAE